VVAIAALTLTVFVEYPFVNIKKIIVDRRKVTENPEKLKIK
jgi:hypothetical protein